jgi:hypothetical protein
MVSTAAPSRRRIRTGIALTLSELLAADVRLGLSRGQLWRVSIDPPESSDSEWPSLATALGNLAGALGGPGRLAVALMPPLTEVRRLDLPPVKSQDLRQLLSRNAGRYFLTAREPQYVGTIGRGTHNSTAPVVGAAASARLVKAIYSAARQCGWIVEGVTPAEIGWQAAALSLWPTFSRGHSHVLVHHPDRTDLLQLEDGGLIGVRRFRAGAIDADLIAAALSEARSNGAPPRVGILGNTEQRVALARTLSRDVVIVSHPPAEWIARAGDPMLIAASFVTPDEGLTLRTESAAELRAVRGRRLTLSIVAATVVLLLLAAVFELWGAKRELAAVNTERARIRPQLRAILASESSFEASNRKLTALFAAQQQSPYISGVIASVTDALPEDAYILSFKARRDTLFLDGLAKHAAGAFDALATAPYLANVQSAAGVQRQLQNDGTALEHFTIQAQMLLPPPSPFRGSKR